LLLFSSQFHPLFSIFSSPHILISSSSFENLASRRLTFELFLQTIMNTHQWWLQWRYLTPTIPF
jgi:hypothetical protein